MRTPTSELPQIQDMPNVEKGEEVEGSGNASVCLHSIANDQHQKQLHLSLDINRPTRLKSQIEYNFFPGHEVDFEVGLELKETKKGNMTEIEVNEYESCANLDLDLKLSSSGSSSSGFLNALASATKRTTAPSLTQETCTSSELDTNENIGGTSINEVSPFIARTCAHCNLHVKVSRGDPKCPKCQNVSLTNELPPRPICGRCHIYVMVPKVDPKCPKCQDATLIKEQPQLIPMGCTHCCMYVMVSKADPRCPKCKLAIVINEQPPLMAMGRRCCYVYSVASKVDFECPKCLNVGGLKNFEQSYAKE